MTSVGELRAGAGEVVDVRKAPGTKHPIIRTHPATGGKTLYLGRRMNGYVQGMDVDASEALLDALWAHCTKPEFTWTHTWRVGDLLIWDNRCTIHRRDAFNGAERRVMHRTGVNKIQIREVSMRALELQNAVGIENLKLVERDVPKAGPGEVVIRLKAASLNYRDLATVSYMGGKFPFVPLSDGAGEIAEVGAGVTRFKVGDRVLSPFFPHWVSGAPTA